MNGASNIVKSFSGLIQLLNKGLKNEALNNAIRESQGVADLLGKLVQLGVDRLG